MKNQNDSEQFVNNQTNTIPWLYDINTEDTNWIITSAFMIFTMQTGKLILFMCILRLQWRVVQTIAAYKINLNNWSAVLQSFQISN